MIRAVRRLHPSMLAVGLALFAGFVVIAIGTVISVGKSGTETPELTDLALPAGVAIVDSHSTCDASACDGLGLVVDRDGLEVGEMRDVIAERLRMDGWTDDSLCEPLVTCLERDDLRVEIEPWVDLEESVAPAMRTSLIESGIDQTDLVYVGYYRCGVLRACG
ncbi:MAG: hypothetical protein V1757_09225 [Actinomycetota bacterium]